MDSLFLQIGAAVMTGTSRDPSLVTLYCTTTNTSEAEHIARTIVRERLAACCNILPQIRSIFHWEGRIEESTEAAFLAKTTSQQQQRAIERIIELHSYDTPCVTVWPIAAVAGGFGEWVRAETMTPPVS